MAVMKTWRIGGLGKAGRIWRTPYPLTATAIIRGLTSWNEMNVMIVTQTLDGEAEERLAPQL